VFSSTLPIELHYHIDTIITMRLLTYYGLNNRFFATKTIIASMGVTTSCQTSLGIDEIIGAAGPTGATTTRKECVQ
jgi:hypothetical protein